MTLSRRTCIASRLALASVACLTVSVIPGVRAADDAPPANSLPVAPVPGSEKAVAPNAEELWPKDVPGATGSSDEDKPAVYAYLPPADKNTGASVLICPGGGFNTRCTDYEGVLVAQWLKARGIAGFVLRYRIRPLYAMRESTLDAQRAMQYLRANADRYHIAADRIGMIGFSAGAELAAAAAFTPLPGKADAADPVDRFPSRADFLLLVYGSARLRGAEAEGAAPAAAPTATPAAPPTFMFCTAEDGGHLNGMVELYAALRRARVPAEVHFYERGEHGVGFAQGDPVLGGWPDLMYNWVRAGGFLTAQKRVAVTGVVTVDGEPLPHGHVVLTPLDAAGAPPVTAYVLNSGPVRGQYNARADRGPTPGRYRVEVYQDATRWVSNSRDPVQQQMSQKQRGGTLTDKDRQEWHEYARKKNLSPSIEDLRVYRNKKPGDGKEMVVEVKADGPNRFDIDVFSK